MAQWDHEVDVLVMGAGCGGLAAAVYAAEAGLSVLVCEKSAQVGGTTAMSGGTVWVPGTGLSQRDGVPDSVEAGRVYLTGEIGNYARPEMIEAFLESGNEAITFLETRTDVTFRAAAHHPDYHPDREGAALGGRALLPRPFDGRLLGRDFALVRPPMPEFLAIGGMMVGREEIPHLVRPFSSFASLRMTLRLVGRHLMDRLRGYPRGTRLLMGNALIGRLLLSARKRSVDVRTGSEVTALVTGEGRVSGAVIKSGNGTQRIGARKGVILATGGFGASAAWRERLMAGLGVQHAVTFAGATGDGMDVAVAAGAAIDAHHASPGFWMPASVMQRRDGSTAVFPHIRDRAKPGLIAVNADGRRFVNEANSYQDFVTAMFNSRAASPTIPAWLVCDRRFVREYGLGLIRPVWQRLQPYIASGYLTRADTIEELATRIGVNPRGLAEQVASHNRFAQTGIDEEFGKGSTALNRHNGDRAIKPNPCLYPIARPPYFAVPVYPAPLGTSAGLATDADARVLNGEGAPIQGLYAVGNDMSSMMQGFYPGPGITLGPAIVFAFRAVQRLAQ